ncbi:hypothetical protein D4764_11G0006620 [Takifugu flavidus]|uniref:Uncharacterized protein n=1 Tax=Takifugu flavidus TaxID=433684 RepID=A0A5C6PI36_9TELE|nr:hypothetical protein D4764_11G0006620 [Takifugu flavidus]
MDKITGLLGDGAVGNILEDQIRDKAADAAAGIFNAVRGGGKEKEEEKKDSGLDVGNILEKVTGGNDDKGGDALEGALKKVCGVESKKEKSGGFLSFLGGDKDKDDKDKKDTGGLFSFGDDKKKDDDDKGGFFSKIFNKDDDEDKDKKSGFKGLFNEQGGASGGGGGEEMPRFDDDANAGPGPGPGLSDGDVFNDLMDVAEEMSEGK